MVTGYTWGDSQVREDTEVKEGGDGGMVDAGVCCS